MAEVILKQQLFVEFRGSNSLRRQTLRQGSPAVNHSHATSNSASASATLDMQMLRRVNRGTWNSLAWTWL